MINNVLFTIACGIFAAANTYADEMTILPIAEDDIIQEETVACNDCKDIFFACSDCKDNFFACSCSKGKKESSSILFNCPCDDESIEDQGLACDCTSGSGEVVA